MAWEVYERNFSEQELCLVGIDQRGGFIARELATRLLAISPLRVKVIAAPRDEAGKISLEGAESLRDKAVLIVDDVLYTGSTFFVVLNAVMQQQPRKVQTAALIDRGHRNLPITADFVGMDLATTLKQHVSVEMTGDGRVDAFIN
jgi:pyrimidine operon attenuation protein/uracil phosphoribosyltransferase